VRQLRIDAATAQSPGPVFQADLLPLAGHQRPRRRLAAKPSVCGGVLGSGQPVAVPARALVRPADRAVHQRGSVWGEAEGRLATS